MKLQIVAYLVAVNLFAYWAFVYDKTMAIGGRRRVPESNLLALALIGGSIGSLAAQQIVRHKTKKEPFRTLLHMIVTLHLAAVIVVVIAGPERMLTALGRIVG